MEKKLQFNKLSKVKQLLLDLENVLNNKTSNVLNSIETKKYIFNEFEKLWFDIYFDIDCFIDIWWEKKVITFLNGFSFDRKDFLLKKINEIINWEFFFDFYYKLKDYVSVDNVFSNIDKDIRFDLGYVICDLGDFFIKNGFKKYNCWFISKVFYVSWNSKLSKIIMTKINELLMKN